jgi:hypothetical protein
VNAFGIFLNLIGAVVLFLNGSDVPPNDAKAMLVGGLTEGVKKKFRIQARFGFALIAFGSILQLWAELCNRVK